MKKRLFLAALTLVAALTAPALAALSIGAKAPAFTLQATQGGNVFTFTLADALKKGPVVLYFYPAAFTKGCTIEAHEFADAIDQYKELGATVIGVSHDPLDKLQKFSVSECRSKFAVAADINATVMKSYDAILPQDTQYANRTSYVIAPDGTIIYTYTNLDPSLHVQNTLNALKAWKADHSSGS
jgi:thioredoxin-dependent peroxiredoxin